MRVLIVMESELAIATRQWHQGNCRATCIFRTNWVSCVHSFTKYDEIWEELWSILWSPRGQIAPATSAAVKLPWQLTPTRGQRLWHCNLSGSVIHISWKDADPGVDSRVWPAPKLWRSERVHRGSNWCWSKEYITKVNCPTIWNFAQENVLSPQICKWKFSLWKSVTASPTPLIRWNQSNRTSSVR